jgi:xylan 1,4-beta-xylosidase
MKFRNPIIPGFYPDPSICRVGEDYYLVTSSFEYFPGVPIFHSRDLVHWRQIGHCLTRPEQLPLANAPASGGIYAPALRFHDGWFYMVTTNVSGGGHFYVKAQYPAGPWSDPVWIEGPWFDPDLFFDEDGKVYFSRMDMGKGIFQREIDLPTGKLVGEQRMIWPGFEDRFCEAPHIYKINGMYYLIVAEGGTHRTHMIVAARSTRPTGPFEGCPHNPLLTHRCEIASSIEHTGHGDLVQSQDGSWWVVFLAVRTHAGRFHLGRETFLAPVTWDADGWPVIHGGKPVTYEMEGPALAQHPWPEPLPRDDFDADSLRLCWNFRRNPDPDSWSLKERAGWLRLWGRPATLDEIGPVAFVGRCRSAARLEFNPMGENEEAGLTIFMNEEFHYDVVMTIREGKRVILVQKRVGDIKVEVANRPYDGEAVILAIDADPDTYCFSYGRSPAAMTELATGQVGLLSCNVAGGFTGVYFGCYATGRGARCSRPADFDWFDYLPSDDDNELH